MDTYYEVTWNIPDEGSAGNRSEDFDTLEEALAFASRINDEYGHFVVVTFCEIIKTFSSKGV